MVVDIMTILITDYIFFKNSMQSGAECFGFHLNLFMSDVFEWKYIKNEQNGLWMFNSQENNALSMAEDI